VPLLDVNEFRLVREAPQSFPWNSAKTIPEIFVFSALLDWTINQFSCKTHYCCTVPHSSKKCLDIT